MEKFEFLMFTDLHLGVHNNNDIWLDSSITLAKTMVDKCIEKNITNVIFLGDFFHDRRSINTKTIWKAQEFVEYFEEAKIHLWLIVGNHDTYLKNKLEPHSLRIFTKYEYIHTIDITTKINDLVTLVPWSENWNKISTLYLMGHFDIAGCSLSENFSDSHGEFSVKDFKKFKGVYSGHFHMPSKIDNITYIGSVMPFTFHDVDSKRGFYICSFSEEDQYTEFIEFIKCPKYKIIFSNKDFKDEEVKGNVVKLVYTEELSTVKNETLLTKINLLEPCQLYTDFKNVITSNDDILLENGDVTIKTNLDIMNEYIDKITIPEHIDINTLKVMIKNLSLKDEDTINE